jgi:hypothetical protein
MLYAAKVVEFTKNEQLHATRDNDIIKLIGALLYRNTS